MALTGVMSDVFTERAAEEPPEEGRAGGRVASSSAKYADAGKTKKKVSANRLTVTVPDKTLRRMHDLVEITESESYSEVVRNALRLYSAVVDEMEKGNQLYLKEPSGEIGPWRIMM